MLPKNAMVTNDLKLIPKIVGNANILINGQTANLPKACCKHLEGNYTELA